jgi:hypothetical protein
MIAIYIFVLTYCYLLGLLALTLVNLYNRFNLPALAFGAVGDSSVRHLIVTPEEL